MQYNDPVNLKEGRCMETGIAENIRAYPETAGGNAGRAPQSFLKGGHDHDLPKTSGSSSGSQRKRKKDAFLFKYREYVKGCTVIRR